MIRTGIILSALIALVGCASELGGGYPGDADGDRISDQDEGRDADYDHDGDGTPDYLDLDSDGDCVPDAAEAGDEDPGTAPRDSDGDSLPDFRDPDADADGLADGDEDKNCNGVADPGETSPANGDTDADGASDLVESAAGTDGLDPSDNPEANGDFVFVMPYQGNPYPAEDDLDFSTALRAVDLYVLVDRSGSMADEINSIRNNMDAVVRNLTCAPYGNGQPGQCIQELWTGVGSFTYYGRNPFIHHLDLQPDPAAVAAAVPGTDNANCDSSGCAEPHLEAIFSVASGQGSGLCQGLASYSGRFSCSNSPAGAGGVGYPCFRPNALPVVLMATDEPFVNGSCAGVQGAAGAAFSIGAKVIGIRGLSETNSMATTLASHLGQLAGLTGAIDGSGQPLVFQGYNQDASAAIEQAVRTVTNNLPLDIGGVAVDDDGDTVNAIDAFVDHIETLQIDSPECSTGLAASDSNGDGFADVFTDVVAGMPLCWKVVPKVNSTVSVDRPTLYKARLDVFGDGVTLLDSRNIFFVVPPDYGVVE